MRGELSHLASQEKCALTSVGAANISCARVIAVTVGRALDMSDSTRFCTLFLGYVQQMIGLVTWQRVYLHVAPSPQTSVCLLPIPARIWKCVCLRSTAARAEVTPSKQIAMKLYMASLSNGIVKYGKYQRKTELGRIIPFEQTLHIG